MNIREYLSKYISEISTNSMTVEELVNDFCNTFCATSGIQRTEYLEVYLSQLFEMYLKNEITEDDMYGALETMLGSSNSSSEISNTSESSGGGSYSSGRSRRSSSSGSSDTTKTTYDVETDKFIKISNNLANVMNIINDTSINTTGVESYVGTSLDFIGSIKTNIITILNDTKEMMTEYLRSVEGVDDSIQIGEPDSLSFEQLATIYREIQENRKLVLATKEFFEARGCTIDGNIATLVDGDTTYKYNFVTHRFSVDGKTLDNVKFYLPKGDTGDYSNTSVYTYFQESGAKIPEGADVIGIEIGEISGRGIHLYDPYYDQVMGTTKFMNKLANTNTDMTRNIIAGHSKCGAVALKVAAASDGLYDTIFCVDNAVIVTGENGDGRNKEQFAKLEDLQKLNKSGTDIYLVSVYNDGNLHHDKNGPTGYEECAFKDSYAITGAEILCRECPDANIYLAYDEQKAIGTGYERVISLMKDIADGNANCEYIGSRWNEFAPSGYSHADGEKLMSSIFGSKIVARSQNNISA